MSPQPDERCPSVMLADADPYPTVLSLHSRYAIDEDDRTIAHTEATTVLSRLDYPPDPAPSDDRSEPDIALYPDLLLLVDALERTDPDALNPLETSELINLYILFSDVQHGANALRKAVTDLLLARMHHD